VIPVINEAGFVQNGANVIITARDGKKTADAAALLNKSGPGRVWAVAADLMPLDGVNKLVAEVQKITPKVDFLINNAGRFYPLCCGLGFSV
jgi:NAD(P)-dependent dehydrogenase (short-subunit alcohol dehydrogenase family)